MQAGNVAQQVVEAVAGDAACGVKVDAVEALHDVHVVRDRVVGHNGLAEALDLDVMAVVGADGHAGSIIWGIVYMISWILACSSVSLAPAPSGGQPGP